MDLSEQLKKDINKKTLQTEADIKNYQQQILVVDAEREPYDNAVSIIDEKVYQDIQEVNNSMYVTQEAYKNRIQSGCRSNLFWAVDSIDQGTGYYNLVVRKLSPNGYPETKFNTLIVGAASSIGILDPETSTIIYRSTDTKIGLQTQNLYAMVYTHPRYLDDIGDTTLGTFIGKIGVGSTELAIVSTTPEELITEFSIDNVIVSTKQGVFPSQTNKIVGFGTTTITGVSTSTFYSVIGIATTSLTTRTLLLENATVGFSSLPEEDGSFVNYTVVIAPDDFEEENPLFKYQIDFTKNPYSPEEVGIIKSETYGKGNEIKIKQNGSPSATQEWKPELKGLTRNGEEIKKPDVGGGSIYFSLGFSYRPTNILGNPVSEGTTISVSPLFLSSLYEPTPSCSSSINNAITSAINAQSQLESNLNVASIVDAVNGIRDERNKYSLRIWGMRQSIGNLKEEYQKLQALDNYIKQQDSLIK